MLWGDLVKLVLVYALELDPRELESLRGSSKAGW